MRRTLILGLLCAYSLTAIAKPTRPITATLREAQAFRPMSSMAPSSPSTDGGGLGRVENWSYAIGLGDGKSLDPAMEASILRYATDPSCSPDTKAKRDTKLSHITLDGCEASKQLVDSLKAQGVKAICYFSAGTKESFRGGECAGHGGTSEGGSVSNGAGGAWSGETKSAMSKSAIEQRFKMCQEKGFVAVEPDNIDQVPDKDSLMRDLNDVCGQYKGKMDCGWKNASEHYDKSKYPNFTFGVSEQGTGGDTDLSGRFQTVLNIKYGGGSGGEKGDKSDKTAGTAPIGFGSASGVLTVHRQTQEMKELRDQIGKCASGADLSGTPISESPANR